MPQITVRQLEKVFRVAERQPGFWGAVRSLAHRRYREVKALHGVDFDIERGELVGYIGPNGAGKSTTIKILSGILTPSGGDCRVNGLSPLARPGPPCGPHWRGVRATLAALVGLARDRVV